MKDEKDGNRNRFTSITNVFNNHRLSLFSFFFFFFNISLNITKYFTYNIQADGKQKLMLSHILAGCVLFNLAHNPVLLSSEMV